MAVDIFVVTRKFVFHNCIIKPSDIEEKYIDSISCRDLDSFLKIAFRYKLKLLLFLDCYENTVFNSKQVEKLSLELKILEDNINSENEVLDIFRRGINMVKSGNDFYLKIEGD